MDSYPLSLEQLITMLESDLADCTPAQREQFARLRVDPRRWRLSPWGDAGGGFWVVAVHRDRVLWFNDIEDGFNVSTFVRLGEIPAHEYMCNQDPLTWALPKLEGDLGMRLGAPQRIVGP